MAAKVLPNTLKLYYCTFLALVTRMEFCPVCGSRDVNLMQRDSSEIRVEFLPASEEFTQVKCTHCTSLWWERG
jgi:uncharacterized protein with PIN domain